jgi:hypothetical protein
MAFKFQFNRKKPTAVKGRPSALIISILVHAVVFLVAGTFVAVTVVQRSEPKFEGKQIVRPKMKLKKLQVPVKIEKKMKQQAPKLSQRVTANTRVQTKAVDFKMPEIAGFGGGVNIDLSGAGLGGGSLAFATPQINVFGLKSSGEKILFILDTNRNMLIDEIGGIPAYKIIKDELTSLISRLPPTSLFNVVVFDNMTARAFSKELSQASDENIKRLDAWLAPLNRDKTRFGVSTLAFPGTTLEFEPLAPIANIQRGWPAALSYGLQKGVDNIYWLGTDDYMREIITELYNDVKRGKPLEYPSGISPEYQGYDYQAYGGKEKWDKLVADAREKLNEENERRKKAGQPIRVVPNHGGDPALVNMYFEGVPIPQRKAAGHLYYYKGDDVLSYIKAMQKKYAAQDYRSASIGLKQKKLSFNVIHFVPKVPPSNSFISIGNLGRLDMVARQMNGQYLKIEGMDAIQSSATARK